MLSGERKQGRRWMSKAAESCNIRGLQDRRADAQETVKRKNSCGAKASNSFAAFIAAGRACSQSPEYLSASH